MTEVCKKLQRSHWTRSEAEGFSSGIWVLWNGDELEVCPKYIHQQFVYLSVVLLDGWSWDLTAVYASPQAFMR